MANFIFTDFSHEIVYYQKVVKAKTEKEAWKMLGVGEGKKWKEVDRVLNNNNVELELNE